MPAFERIDGVASVDATGLVEQQVTVTPVSYTHLDVYKRQMPLLILVRALDGAALFPQHLDAVSYTHLRRRAL